MRKTIYDGLSLITFFSILGSVSTIFLSVVIPSYDEMANLQKGVLEKVKSFLDKKNFSYEVIIVDDGSKDGSREFVKKFVKENKHFALIENPHTGKAGAVTVGMLAAKGEYVLFTDMDQATPIEELDNLLPYLLHKKYAVAIASRTIGNMGYPWSRLVLHDVHIFLRKLIAGLPEIFDTQCGFKLFTHEAAQSIFSRLQEIHHGFKEINTSAVQAGFDVELLLIGKARGFAIKEVPAHWLYVESRRVSPLRDSLEGIINLLAIRKDKWRGIYK